MKQTTPPTTARRLSSPWKISNADATATTGIEPNALVPQFSFWSDWITLRGPRSKHLGRGVSLPGLRCATRLTAIAVEMTAAAQMQTAAVQRGVVPSCSARYVKHAAENVSAIGGSRITNVFPGRSTLGGRHQHL